MNQNIYKTNQIFLITVLVSLAASFMPLGQLFPDYAVRLLFSEIILAAPGAAYLLAGRRSYARAVRMKRIRLGTVLWLVLFTVCIMPFMGMVNAISMLFVENVTSATMSGIVSGHSYLLSMILIALLPCVFEESVYRGLFYNEYRKVSPVRGMLLSALLFGLMHGNLNQFSYAFLMGIIFALVIEATDSILASMIMHFLINGFSTTMMEVMSRLEDGLLQEAIDAVQDPQTLGGVIRMYLPIAAIGLIFAAVVYSVMAASEGRLEYVRSLFHIRTASRKRVEKAALEEIEKYQEREREELGREKEAALSLEENGAPEEGKASTAEDNGVQEDGKVSFSEKNGIQEEGAAPVSEAEKPYPSNGKETPVPGADQGVDMQKTKPARAGKPRLLTAPLVAGIVICSVLMILNEILD